MQCKKEQKELYPVVNTKGTVCWGWGGGGGGGGSNAGVGKTHKGRGRRSGKTGLAILSPEKTRMNKVIPFIYVFILLHIFKKYNYFPGTSLMFLISPHRSWKESLISWDDSLF